MIYFSVLLLRVVQTGSSDDRNCQFGVSFAAFCKEARLSKNLTQQQLGEKIGVKKSQISRLEKGRSVSVASMARVFKAMGIPLALEIGGKRKVALW